MPLVVSLHSRFSALFHFGPTSRLLLLGSRRRNAPYSSSRQYYRLLSQNHTSVPHINVHMRRTHGPPHICTRRPTAHSAQRPKTESTRIKPVPFSVSRLIYGPCRPPFYPPPRLLRLFPALSLWSKSRSSLVALALDYSSYVYFASPLLARVFFFLGRKMWKMESSFPLSLRSPTLAFLAFRLPPSIAGDRASPAAFLFLRPR